MPRKIENNIKALINLIIESDPKYRLDRDVMNVIYRLSMDKDAHVPDTLTRIRALPTVTVVGQDSRVFRPSQSGGKSYIDIYVKFLPLALGKEDNIRQLAKKIKSLPGVQFVKARSVDGIDFLISGKPLVL